MLLLAALAACGEQDADKETAEAELSTDGTLSRYHWLLSYPAAVPLAQNGYVIGIEKSPRPQIGLSRPGEPDLERLDRPDDIADWASAQDRGAQQFTFDKTLDDPKSMFVSHVMRYSVPEHQHGIQPALFYSAYPCKVFQEAGGRHCAGQGEEKPVGHYEAGWEAMDRFADRLISDAKGHNYTHLLFLSMGWNNDQEEALHRYNTLIHTMRTAAQRDNPKAQFDPLVVALTWPSVWGGQSVVDTLNKALHIGSYPVKASDADEIALTYANHILNNILPRVEKAVPRLRNRTIAIGHSMGARILAGAFYAGHLLERREPWPAGGPLVVGLQPAFSANRFRENHQLIPPFRWLTKGEGGPFQHPLPGTLAITWSEGDKANPVARFLTGAKHTGGKPGWKVMKKNLQGKAALFTWEGSEKAEADCRAARRDGKLSYINATSIIRSHNDIFRNDVGELIWAMAKCADRGR